MQHYFNTNVNPQARIPGSAGLKLGSYMRWSQWLLVLGTALQVEVH